MISRRRFLQAACLLGGLGLGGLLQACGGTAGPIASGGTASGSAAASKSSQSANPAASAAAPAASASGKPAASVSSAKPAGSTAPGGPTSLTVGYNTIAGSMWPLWMADAIHAFSDYHLDVKVQYVEAATSVTALISRDLDLLQAGGPPVLTAGLAGQDVVFVASALNRAIISLYTLNAIKTTDDLKGKTIASDKPGSPLDYAMRIALAKQGLKDTDLTVLRIGSEAVFPTMLAGKVDGGMVAPPLSFAAETKGFHNFQDTFDTPYQNTCIVATRSHLQQIGGSMPAFLAAYRQGIIALKQQPDLALKILQQYSKETDQNILKRTYDFYLGKTPFDESLQPNVQGIQGMLGYFADFIPAAKTAKAEQFVDASYIAPALALPKPS